MSVCAGERGCVRCQTCSLMLLMPSGPSRFTACLTRSVRPQLSILKPRSCRNLASVEAASSFLVAQKQSSALQTETADLLLWLRRSLCQKWDLSTYISTACWGKLKTIADQAFITQILLIRKQTCNFISTDLLQFESQFLNIWVCQHSLLFDCFWFSTFLKQLLSR